MKVSKPNAFYEVFMILASLVGIVGGIALLGFIIFYGCELANARLDACRKPERDRQQAYWDEHHVKPPFRVGETVYHKSAPDLPLTVIEVMYGYREDRWGDIKDELNPYYKVRIFHKDGEAHATSGARGGFIGPIGGFSSESNSNAPHFTTQWFIYYELEKR